MPNERTELIFKDCGITLFGYYSHKTPVPAMSKHDHGSCYEICYMKNGIQPYYIYPPSDGDINAQMYNLHGGEVFITKPHECHSTGEFRQLRGHLYWIQLDESCPALLKQTPECSDFLKQELKSINRHLIRVPQSVSLQFTRAFDLMLNPNKSCMLRACEMLTLFILELADFNRKISDESSTHVSVSPEQMETMTFIQNNLFNEELDIDMIASHLNYSRARMMTLFKKEMGITVHEYILQSKINLACELLKTHSVTETAALLNFSSSQHLSKVFKEQTGLTPSQYIQINH